MLQRELKSSCKTFDSGAKFAFSERGQLVEPRLDHGRIKNDHDELEANPVRFIINIKR